MKTFKFKTNNDRWMWSLETAFIRITSEKGTVLTFDKWEKSSDKNKWSAPHAGEEIIKELVWKIACVPNGTTLEFTREESMLLLKYSDKQGVVPKKKRYSRY